MKAGLVSWPAISDLRAVMRDLFPEPMGIGVTDPGIAQPPLMTAELPATIGMVPGRLREFSAGRHAARQAMMAMGQPARPILLGEDRAPIWPKGLHGSIAHCDSVCVAVVTSGQETVGVDIEPDQPLEAELTEVIATPIEGEWLLDCPNEESGHLLLRLFCAKEAVYKAQYPISGQLFDFHTLKIEISDSGSAFQAIFLRTIGPFERGHKVCGQIRAVAGFVVVGVTLNAD